MDLLKDVLKVAASMIIVLAALMGYSYLMYHSGYSQAKSEAQPIIIYQVDNAGTEMFGKVTSKDVIDRHYIEEVQSGIWRGCRGKI
ncbi:DUF1372 family protein [Streptococcus suis]|nr:DUF1372 family protein [Streptococcus suis]